jgi:hypothetical protein
MEGIRNPFTEQGIPRAFLELNMDKTVTVEPTDAAYSHVAHAHGLDPSGQHIEEKGYTLVKPVTTAIEHELAFLNALGLVIVRGPDEYYVSPLADILYGSDGIFELWPSQQALTDLGNFLLTYVIPGHQIRSGVLDTQKQEAESLIQALQRFIGTR